MQIGRDDANVVKGYLKGKRLSFERIATLVVCHRTTISRKLGGAQDVTAVELIEIGEQIGRYEAGGRK